MRPGCIVFSIFIACGLSAVFLLTGLCLAQIGPSTRQNQAERTESSAASEHRARAEMELQQGTLLSHQASFAEAIPHLQAARGHVANEYAASFNLALCYVGTRQYRQAIAVLEELRKDGHANADVENLLAQALVGNRESGLAFDALKRASTLTPNNEKLYMFVADACMEQHDYALGLNVVDLGLTSLPNSARLHYERAVFLSQLDEFDRARVDFQAAQKLDSDGEISCLAAAYEAMYGGEPARAIPAAREGLSKGHQNATLLTILGESLLRAGAHPGESEFGEAQAALEKAVALQPRDVSARTSLGRLYLVANRTAAALAQLERARELDPGNPSVYALLAKAYQRQGNSERAQEALTRLTELNAAQAEKIGSAPGDRKASYAGSRAEESPGRR